MKHRAAIAWATVIGGVVAGGIIFAVAGRSKRGVVEEGLYRGRPFYIIVEDDNLYYPWVYLIAERQYGVLDEQESETLAMQQITQFVDWDIGA